MRRRRRCCPTLPTSQNEPVRRSSTSARPPASPPMRARCRSRTSTRTTRCTSSSGASFRIRRSRGRAKARSRVRARDVPRGLGSGFVISTDGYVMTNAHVVEGADEITVTLTDRREFKGKVIGTDRRTDVALVKIEATGLPSVKIGDAEQAARRRMGRRHRLAVRPRQLGHRRHRQRQSARDGRVPAVHPDRRRRESRQLRRPAAQHARRGDRHQFADLHDLGRLQRHLFRDSDRRGDERAAAAALGRARDPRPHRRRDRRRVEGNRRGDRPRCARRAVRSSTPSRRKGRLRKPGSRPAT